MLAILPRLIDVRVFEDQVAPEVFQAPAQFKARLDKVGVDAAGLAGGL